MNLFNFKIIQNTLNWLMPVSCIRCGKPDTLPFNPCCEKCYPQLPFHPASCHQCGQILNANLDICGQCLVSPPAYDACFCPFEYEQPIDQLIRQFKYHGRPELAKLLAQILSKEIRDNAIEIPDLLIPVPLHISRLRSRGFNQSLLLCQELGKILDIDTQPKALIKKRKTLPQAELDVKLRNKNLRGSFELKQAIRYKSVAIVDDVITTGSTVSEIAKVLKRNGVDYVQAWGIAHTV